MAVHGILVPFLLGVVSSKVVDVNVWGYVVAVLGSYGLGSIPTGFWLGCARGMDIRKVGSGNIGATNTMRALGKPTGFLVLLLDIAKGYVAVFAFPRLCAELPTEPAQILCCLAVIAGHNWTFWLKFKGGKGIATSAGALLAFLPYPLLIGLGVWIVVFAIWRYVSLASIAAAAVLPLATGLLTRNIALTGFTLVIAALAIYKHRSNIQRLRAGTENRIGSKKTQPA